MVHATFLIAMNNLKYTTVSGYFKDATEAHQKAYDIAQCKDNEIVTCYVDGVMSGFVSRHGDKTVYGD
jgi:hypothetical protein